MMGAWRKWMAALAVAAVALPMTGAWLLSDDRPQRIPPEQPVPFSHRLHVDEVQIDCRYCHAFVETSSYAGVPPTSTCATCHYPGEEVPLLRPLVWLRVAALPGHSYFDHSIHGSKGIGCETCHGRVDQMDITRAAQDFTMSWCLDCHRDPAPYLRPLDQITSMGVTQTPRPDLRPDLHEAFLIADRLELTHCYVCHR